MQSKTNNRRKPEILDLSNGQLGYLADCFSATQSKVFFTALQNKVNWTQRNLYIYGKQVTMPRLIAWYADPNIQYRYSGQLSEHNDWLPELLTIKTIVEAYCNCRFNGALLNYYRNGQDSMSWHSDDEKALGKNPCIASVSFGAERKFKLRHRQLKQHKLDLMLANGSLLFMQGETQHFWQHQLPKTQRPVPPRINITFRYIL